ncbi:MAG: DUF952 domain-containing protein [Polyangiaceae bacterium]|nr:DUF952 domain-containing protein [Polyangiaceae bacterium]
MRFLYHIVPRGTDVGSRYAPASLVMEGFVHCSFRDEVRESALLYFPHDIELEVFRVDPRRLDVPVELASSPRGPMPHVRGSIPADAVVERLSLDALAHAADRVTGTRFVFVAFENMTLLDLVGALDPVGRIASMGFDPSAKVEVVGATDHCVWSCEGATLTVDRVRPDLTEADVVIVPGGLGTRTLVKDEEVVSWLGSFPHNRLIASVCTGSMLLGAAGRLKGKRATTHHSAMSELANYGAVAVNERVVDEGQLVTAGGVSCALDLGMHIVRRFEGQATAEKIAAQMQLPPEFGRRAV